MEIGNTYSTRDIAEASALLARGQKLIAVNKVDSVCYFNFKDAQVCKQTSNEYFFGELLVNARLFHESFIRLKNKIFQ